jgi:electron transfer flavoprotein alpha subunit
VLAVIPVRSGELCAGGAEALAEALSAGGSGILVIHRESDLTAEICRYLSERVEVVRCGDFAPGAWSRQLLPLVNWAPVVLLPASPDGRDLAPRLSAGTPAAALAGAVQVTAQQITVPRSLAPNSTASTLDSPMVATLQVGVRGVDESELHRTAATQSPDTISALHQ